MDIKEKIQQLLSSQQLAVLSTQRDDSPYASLIAFISDKELKYIVFATSKNTRKYLNLQMNPKVALLINNATNQPLDFYDASAVTITGQAQNLNLNKKKNHKLISQYLEKYPYLKDFINSPTCSLIFVKAEAYYLVENFQYVTEMLV